MKIALLHYHLKAGGVTTVIRHQVEALKEDCRLLVLSGEPPQSPFPVPVRHIAGLAYDAPAQPPRDPHKIAAEIHQAILGEWEGGCDLLHVHNPTIAKNNAFLDILEALQERGIKLFLHIHDFAEDGRPGAYFPGDYPDDCHYGVINSRDYRLLLAAGLKPEGLHTLHNPVKALGASRRSTPAGNDILYPVRAIRRKNIGESLLLSLYFQKGHALSITLPPNSPADLAAYNGWKRFARENHLEVHFDKGVTHRFEDLVGGTPYLITTSITEGFGYAFLEAWTAGKLVRGRNLADITRDFAACGLQLEHLYNDLPVPLEWIDHRRFFSQWGSCLLKNSRHFGLPLDPETIAHIVESMQAAGRLDFGLLNESHQKAFIRRLIKDPAKRKHLAEINPLLEEPVLSADTENIIRHNRRIVSTGFTMDSCRENLLDVYQKVARRDVKQHIDKSRLAASFFKPERFSLLKWGPYVE